MTKTSLYNDSSSGRHDGLLFKPLEGYTYSIKIAVTGKLGKKEVMKLDLEVTQVDEKQYPERLTCSASPHMTESAQFTVHRRSLHNFSQFCGYSHDASAAVWGRM